MQMVYSNMKYKESINSDDSDDRTTKFYHKEMLVEIDDDKDIDPAYSMIDGEIPFGYEFVKKATMREINFGEKDFSGEKLFVAGEEAVRKGFLVCKYCGKIQLPNKSPQHTRYCRVVKDARTVPIQTVSHGSDPDSGSGHIAGYIQGEGRILCRGIYAGNEKEIRQY